MANAASSGNKNRYAIRIVISVIVLPKVFNLYHFLGFLDILITFGKSSNKID